MQNYQNDSVTDDRTFQAPSLSRQDDANDDFQQTPSAHLPNTQSSETSNKMEHSPKSQDSEDPDRMEVDVAPWKGWAELENDPIIFTTILRDWGVRNVQVNEVIPLDTILEKTPQDVYGLIFLSRWAAAETTNEASEIPTTLWFANQISTFSCATLALMNIINNQNDLSIGDELRHFKTITQSMTPKQRGLALDDFQFVKDIHNSFSKKLERMEVDLRLKEDVQAAARKSKKSRKKLTKRKKKKGTDDSDNGFHFVAYVPVQNHVWRLDGLERHPRNLGPIEDTDSWLTKTIADLQTTLEAPGADDMEFSLLSLVNEPDVDGDEARTARMKEDWAPFIAHMIELHAEKGDLSELLVLG